MAEREATIASRVGLRVRQLSSLRQLATSR